MPAPIHASRLLAVVLLVLTTPCALAQAALEFSPTGTAKGVRQAHARFAEAMVPIGDPALRAPFNVDCPVPGEGRWVDARNWTYDFERPLPGGLRCRFLPVPDLRTLAGAPPSGLRAFDFDTGGPAVITTEPWAGAVIDEEQAFLLGLDAPATPGSMSEHVRCRAAGVVETIGVRMLEGADRERLLEANPWFLRRHFQQLRGPGSTLPDDAALRVAAAGDDLPVAIVQCRQRLPGDAPVALDIGPGLAAPSGVVSTGPQRFEFRTRAEFRARVACERVNQDADCIPALPLRLELTAPVARERIADFVLRLPDGSVRQAQPAGAAEDEVVYGAVFAGPFPERAALTLELPAGLTDDASRPLANAASFPFTVRTDEDPPLARFAADFGILERASPLLPLTVRNLEATRSPAAASTPPAAAEPSIGGFIAETVRRILNEPPAPDRTPLRTAIEARVLAVPAGDAAAIGRWFVALRDAKRDDYRYDEKSDRYVLTRRAGERSLLAGEQAVRTLTVPRASHAKAFEVIGIPLEQPGLYVVEVASAKLGAALYGKPGTYFAQSLALVTNLGVHFKWGRESSLAWVTALDDGRPVHRAEVAVADCKGAVLWRGRTDAQGRAAIEAQLPETRDLPVCDWNSQGLVVSARLGDDTGFVATEWNRGIANWQFGLPGPGWQAPQLARTVLDRSLLRPGETLHMKHVLREHTQAGFRYLAPAPFAARVRHPDSGDEFPLEARFDPRTASGVSRWTVPAGAKLGAYQVEIAAGDQWLRAADFRVEQFRVPLLRAALQVRPDPAVAVETVDLDLQVTHFSGGGAAALPVTVRGLVEPRTVSFGAYDGYTFMNGDVVEGRVDEAAQAWRGAAPEGGTRLLEAARVTLDEGGGARVALSGIAAGDRAASLVAEAEYHDPNGEVLTASRRVALWPSAVVLGIKPEGWALSRERIGFTVLALDLEGQPLRDVEVEVDLLQRLTYSHRKRLIGGFYAYENETEIKRLGAACSGRTDALGRLACAPAAPVAGNLILRARTVDAAGHPSTVHREVWVAGSEDWWYEVGNEDRMELLPERRRYEPGETARLQVRMPFRTALALVTVEREGVLDSFVTELDGSAPVVEVPLRGHYAPNVFVSVLAVRGRVAGVQPTALVDLGRPAFKLGVTEIEVGWRAHELEVTVTPTREHYPVRGTATVDVKVARADGGALPQNAELAFAAVDEGLLALAPNESWALLEQMLGRRGAEVRTATAQMQVVGRRHFGRKAVHAGGGGGTAPGMRTLFDTLLAWKPRVQLDSQGQARIQVPLNDSLTSFRLVAVATAGANRFGTGAASVRTTQDLMLFAGLPPVVREGDRFSAGFTVRNASDRPLETAIEAEVAVDGAEASTALPAQHIALAPGHAQEVAWPYTVPPGTRSLAWRVQARASGTGGARDAVAASQRVEPAVPVRTVQATTLQLTGPLELPVARPAAALPGRGEVLVALESSAVDALDGVRTYLHDYDYTCLEQRVSQAVALEDAARWEAVVAELPAHLDGDGLARYFRGGGAGSDVLSAYLVAIAADSGRPLPEPSRARLRSGLRQFVEGRIERDSPLRTADLALRKLAAIAALARDPGDFDPLWLDAVDLTPALWPTSGLLDWLEILQRVPALPQRSERLAEAERLLRARLALRGTSLQLVSEPGEALPWLMVSPDVSAARLLLVTLERPGWQADAPRLVNGALGRLRAGHWDTTTANAWGVTALRRFAARFEGKPVVGTTRIGLAGAERRTDWAATDPDTRHALPWPTAPAPLAVAHEGGGAPWLQVQARAAVPRTEPYANGLAIRRSITPVAQQAPGAWRRGDVYRVRLTLDAQSELTWVVVDDPIPGGASILGTGLGRDSAALVAGESGTAPTFEERSFEAYRAYFEYLPQGVTSIDYTVRLNGAGEFLLPPTRAEAMYAPDIAGETPNAPLTVQP